MLEQGVGMLALAIGLLPPSISVHAGALQLVVDPLQFGGMGGSLRELTAD